ncbi:hypothetical protein [uncultured Williamsia sp.]|uniref:hypothetical protein n=1 Tax=uncultured Williamsia sp. TaxID=259311 RepID=UPI002617819E|nr:hypothetical protein [uncultured Williamsia sp.]
MISLRKSTVRRVTATAAAVAAVAVIPVAGANAATGDDSVPFTPTVSVIPGSPACAAVLSVTKLPQTVSRQYRVKVSVARIGTNCGQFIYSVKWRNLTEGGSGGQYGTVASDGTVDGRSDGISDGFGYAPGAGRIAARVDTYSKSDESGEISLPHIAGTATFTLR